MFQSVEIIKSKTQERPWEVTASDAGYLLHVIDILEENLKEVREERDNLVQSYYAHSKAMFGNMITSMLSATAISRQADEAKPVS